MWTSGAKRVFREKMLGKNVTIEIFSFIIGVASVDLYLGETCVNIKMLEKGFADECDESYCIKKDNEHRQSKQAERVFVSPEVEFKLKIDEEQNDAVAPHPPMKNCLDKIKLKGPFSPLEATLRGVARIIQRNVTVDHNSVNCVLLADERSNFRGKFCVAADMTVNINNKHITIRESTMMPNLTGLDVILALIFASTAEIRRDQRKTAFLSIITGLGFDQKHQRPFYAERDTFMPIDFCLTTDDLEAINHLRYCMSSMLISSDGEYPDIVEGEKRITLKMIQKNVLEILKVKRKPIETVFPDHFQWDIDQQDVMTRTNPKSDAVMFDFHGIPPLADQDEEMRNELLNHVKMLARCSKGMISMSKKVCRLCDFSWTTKDQLAYHLLSKKHVAQAEALRD
jgi:ATP-dependent RNA helicase TDRD9